MGARRIRYVKGQEMKNNIREARVADIPAMIEMAELKRMEYQTYQPQFWRKAANSAQVQTLFYEKLLGRDDVYPYIYEKNNAIAGYVIASLVKAPPVYDPGGLSCLIDDFYVSDSSLWETVGVAILDHVKAVVKTKGAVHMVIICAAKDKAKQSMLEKAGYPTASEWHLQTL